MQAGFILSDLTSYLVKNGYEQERIKGLLKFLSHFEFIPSVGEDSKIVDPDPIIAVANNIISRGLPTFASVFLEQKIVDDLHITNPRVDDTGTLLFPITSEYQDLPRKIYKALHVVAPSINRDETRTNLSPSWEKLGSDYEEGFLLNEVPKYLGKGIQQLFESQRDIISIIRFATDVDSGLEKYLTGAIDKFHEQNIDFAIEFPYSIGGKRGISIEIDGPQHDDSGQKLLDSMRDDALLKAKWMNTLRIKTSEFEKIHDMLHKYKDVFEDEYFAIINENCQKPLWTSEAGKAAIQYVLIPFAVARIQKAILYFLLHGYLDLNSTNWKIGILERDIPCASIAIEDFKKLLEPLLYLEGENRKLPDIELFVINNEEFKDIPHTIYESNCEEFPLDLDLVIDISLLNRYEQISDKYKNCSKFHAKVFSGNSIKSERKFVHSELVKYDRLIDFMENENGLYDIQKIHALRSILQTIFRKKTFRPGQIEIINRSLQLKSVVGLLPTGSGKSLTYQLSALLQPGSTIIVDPIKSLMKDQYDNLLKTYIDACIYINSSLRTAKEREIAATKMVNANVMLTFISPERLQIRNFRNHLTEMSDTYQNYFAYCVIDEAHCVSEWGHDFRTSYLKLGENAKNYCKVNSEHISKIPMIGLTATASFDVLSDVQRELDLEDEAIIRSDSSDRPELIYKIHKIESQDPDIDDKQHWILLSTLKQNKTVELLKDLSSDYERHLEEFISDESKQELILKNFNKNSFYSNSGEEIYSGLVFCPHRTWEFGVLNVSNNIINRIGDLSVGTFSGSSGEDTQEYLRQSMLSEENQEKFINDEISLLVATKAFGMGIDKPNIRYTFHFNYPSSIEGFYQEAGRAGRDGKLAICYILFADNVIESNILASFHNNSFRGTKKEKTIIYELLDSITFPSEVNVSKLSGKIAEDHGLDLNMKLWPPINPTRLYVNESFGRGYGYFNIDNMGVFPDTRVFPLVESNRVLNIVSDTIHDLLNDGEAIRDWVTEVQQRDAIDGIERQLARINYGEKLALITIGFRNIIIKKITEILQQNITNDFTERIVSESARYCSTSDDFLKNLVKEYWEAIGRNITISQEIKDILSTLFIKIRDEQDTFKAVYRLSIIGVIDDYQIDYNAKTIVLTDITKKTDEEYIDKLYKYLLRYISKNRAGKVKEEVYNYRGETIIQKCLGYLIDFVYSEISKKREVAIYSMRDACIEGAEKGHKEFRQYLALYFNSKYYPALRDDTNLGKEFSFALVIAYIDLTDGLTDNLKHLRGACIRLLNENPDNATFLLLKTFALFLLELKNEKFIAEAKESFSKGFELLKMNDQYTMDIYIKNIHIFKSKILNYNQDLEPLLNNTVDTLLIHYHNDWLENFNNKFMVDHGR